MARGLSCSESVVSVYSRNLIKPTQYGNAASVFFEEKRELKMIIWGDGRCEVGKKALLSSMFGPDSNFLSNYVPARQRFI